MIEVLLSLLGFLFGAGVTEYILRRLRAGKQQELKEVWTQRDLNFAEREANRRLYELDPSLAIELGYEPPKVEKPSREISGETASNPYDKLLSPGLSKFFNDQLQQWPAYDKLPLLQQDQELLRRGQEAQRQLGNYVPQSQFWNQLQQTPYCTCGADFDPFWPSAAHRKSCPKFPQH